MKTIEQMVHRLLVLTLLVVGMGIWGCSNSQGYRQDFDTRKRVDEMNEEWRDEQGLPSDEPYHTDAETMKKYQELLRQRYRYIQESRKRLMEREAVY